MDREFEELHKLLEKWATLVEQVYRIDKGQKANLNLYDIFNSPKTTGSLKDCQPLERGNINFHILDKRFGASYKIVQNSRLQNESDETSKFCSDMQIALNRAKKILEDFAQESAYDEWLSRKEKAKKKLPKVVHKPINSRPKPNSGGVSKKKLPNIINKPINRKPDPDREPDERDLDKSGEKFKPGSSGRTEQSNRFMDLDALHNKVFWEIFSVFSLLCLLFFLVLWISSASYSNSHDVWSRFWGLSTMWILVGVAVARQQAKQYVDQKIVSGISNSYLSSINIALGAEAPDQIAFEITALLNELEQYGLCRDWEDRWQTTYSNSSQSSSISTTYSYGNPNIAKLKEIANMSQAFSEDWQDRTSVEQARGMEDIRQRLERERIHISQWIMNNRLTIHNANIRPRHYSNSNPYSNWGL